ncbi:MAG: NYN domain-containing protein [bacterium]|nr:NYN domain-containing protein [bacterium]
MKIFEIFKRSNELSQIRNNIDEMDRRIRKIEFNLRNLRIQKVEWKDLKVGVFVDVQNMFYAAKSQFEARLDYVKLLHHIVKGRRLVKAIAYIIENPEINQSGFISLLSHHSFEIRRKPLIQRADGSQKGDWDIGIALDVLNLVEWLDVVSLVSGDGDFVSLVEDVKARGPRVEVYGFPQNTAIDLKEIADEFFPIGDELILKQ